MFGICYITQGQQIDIAGFNFDANRILLLLGAIRVIARQELQQIAPCSLDKWLAAYPLVVFAVTTVARGSESMAYYAGLNYNVLLSYFVFRSLLRTREDILSFLSVLGVFIVPLALFMLYESVTGYNVFKLLGGIKDSPVMREGSYRCQGSFRISITAGCFGATLIPIFVGLYLAGISRARAITGIVAGLVITLTSNSSGPLMALMNGVVAWGLWRIRSRMRMVRWSLVAIFGLLSLIMNAPVYYLIARVGNVVGGGGWHRARLIEQFINHFDRWWLLGTTETRDWMPTVIIIGDRVGADITNKFIGVGIDGGLLALVIFIGIFVVAYRGLGRALLFARAQQSPVEWVWWGLGCTLFAHIMAITSVQYWDQMDIAFYMSMALIGGVGGMAQSEQGAVSGDFQETTPASASGLG